jgi:hypothetical protein
LREDVAFELPQRASRFEAELLGKQPSPVLIGLERLRVAAGPVESEHQLSPRPFSQRVLGHEALELADQVGVAPQREVGLDPFLERPEAQLSQPCDFGPGERLVGELVQRPPAPQTQRVPQHPGGLCGLAGGERPSPLVEQRLEPARVDRGQLDAQEVPGCAGDDPVVA